MVFQKLICQGKGRELMDTLDFLSTRLYCRLPPSYDPIIRRLEVAAARLAVGCLQCSCRTCQLLLVSLIRCFLVYAVRAKQLEEVRAFFRDFGDLLMAGPEAAEWSAWFALPYVHAPASHPSFKARRCPPHATAFSADDEHKSYSAGPVPVSACGSQQA